MEKTFDHKKHLLQRYFSKIRRSDSAAILTHYEAELLHEVFSVHQRNPAYRFTLVSPTNWHLAEIILDKQGFCKLYFTYSHSLDMVIGEARLHSVNFELAQEDTQSLLQMSFATLYEISHACLFDKALPVSIFRRIIDEENQGLASDFSLVYEIPKNRQLIG